MKFRKPVLALAFLMLMIAIWCMTPPETSLITKSICTASVISAYFVGFMQSGFGTFYQKSIPVLKLLRTCAKSIYHFLRLCTKGISRFIHLIIRPFKALGRLVVKFLDSDSVYWFRNTCSDKAKQLSQFADLCYTKFINWSIQADHQLVRKNCQTIANQLGYDKQPHHPLYRIKTWFNLTSIFCFISVCIGGMILACQRNIISLIILNLFNFFILVCVLLNLLLITETEKLNSSTTPILGGCCLAIQIFLLFALIAIALAPPAEASSFFKPYFNIKLGPIGFPLSIAQFILIISIVLFLACYSHLCCIIHEIAHTPPTAYVTSES